MPAEPMEENAKAPQQGRISKRMSMRRPLWIAVIGASLCALSWLCWGIYLYWNDIKLVNFLAAWIPFVLSILLAFVPEHNMSTKKKIAWRSSVIAVGFIWSVVLWHQQVIADKTARDDQTRIVTQAVTQSNEHSDQQISPVREDVKDIKKAAQKLDSRLADISKQVSQSESDISGSIAKVNKPEPPELARLQFSLFDAEAKNIPKLVGAVQQDKDGNFPVDVMFTNITGTTAETIDIWIGVCDLCSYAVEPTGFDKPSGTAEQVRHMVIAALNPGTSWQKTTIIVKTTLKSPASLGLGFRYACKTCGKQEKPQQVSVSF
jgi:hypothetical protein